MTQRHAEIAGAGFGGLVAAVALAQRGWSVRVHEKTPVLRAEGFAIAMQPNMLRVLESLGLRQRIVEGGLLIVRRETRNERNEATMALRGQGAHRVSRQHIVNVLADTAARLGVVIEAESPVAGADPAGALLLADGRRLVADLVIGADGVHSAVRDSLGLVAERRQLGDGATRTLVSRTPQDVAEDATLGPLTCEYWAGTRRVITSPCSQRDLYVVMSCLAGDAAGRAIPVDVASWSASFPHLAPLFERIVREADPARILWTAFETVRLRRWHAGRVAVLGDAAHAMPPNLGQGSGCAMMNALALAVALDNVDDVEAGAGSVGAPRAPPHRAHPEVVDAVRPGHDLARVGPFAGLQRPGRHRLGAPPLPAHRESHSHGLPGRPEPSRGSALMTALQTTLIGPAPRIAVDHAGAGPLVVFLHGIGGNRTNWREQIEALSDAFLCAAWDARGYGASDDYDGPLALSQFNDDLLRVLDHFGRPAAHLVGLSMGGTIAQNFYRHHPKKVLSMVLADTRNGFQRHNSEEFLRRREAPLLAGLTPADIAPNLAPTLAARARVARGRPAPDRKHRRAAQGVLPQDPARQHPGAAERGVPRDERLCRHGHGARAHAGGLRHRGSGHAAGHVAGTGPGYRRRAARDDRGRGAPVEHREAGAVQRGGARCSCTSTHRDPAATVLFADAIASSLA